VCCSRAHRKEPADPAPYGIDEEEKDAQLQESGATYDNVSPSHAQTVRAYDCLTSHRSLLDQGRNETCSFVREGGSVGLESPQIGWMKRQHNGIEVWAESMLPVSAPLIITPI
jgi:hypothetical protein